MVGSGKGPRGWQGGLGYAAGQRRCAGNERSSRSHAVIRVSCKGLQREKMAVRGRGLSAEARMHPTQTSAQAAAMGDALDEVS
jgi:hypothetical protein